jgi:hypothetical protein
MTAWERCEGRCAVSGLDFSEAHVGGGRARRLYAPSLDRIDPRRGYEPDNVRLVCEVADFAMNALPIALERRISAWEARNWEISDKHSGSKEEAASCG